MGCLGVMPPRITSKRLGEARVFCGVTLQALANEGETPRLATEAQGHQTFAFGCQLQLRIKVVTEIDASAEVKQPLQSVDGGGMGFVAAAVAPFLLAKSQTVQPFGANQSFFSANTVVLVDEVPSDVVEQQLQRPDPEAAAGAVWKRSNR